MLQTVGFKVVPNKSKMFGTPLENNLPRCTQMLGQHDIFDYN
jgi:hypothetical protein